MAQREPVSVLLYRLQQHLQGISEIVGELADQLAEPSAEAKSLGSSQREFLNERQMAEYLGITKRALEGRRYRGQFPTDVCVMIEGKWLYSVSRYEAWVESLWPARPAAGARRTARSRKGLAPKAVHLLV